MDVNVNKQMVLPCIH